MTDYSVCIDFLLTRRSIRRFEDRDVPDDVIKKILDVARFAPSARNRQPWVFIVVRDKGTLEKLASLHHGAAPLRNAPVAIVVACNHEESSVSYQVDCACASMYIMLAAHALGLGSVWIQALRNPMEIREAVGLPENYTPVSIIALGYPAEKPEPKPRKNLEEIAFRERYGVKFVE